MERTVAGRRVALSAASAALLGALGLAALAPTAVAQVSDLTWKAGAVAAWMHVDPTAEARAGTELRVLQPSLAVRARRGGLTARITANLEGLTIPDGELAPGNWGEGFVDRRHPHTYLHELMVSGVTGLGGWRFGVAAGKGFVPFGSDDPMHRPLLRYPVNHHLAQILERAVVIGQVARGPLRLEAALFNGDEPDRPGAWPRLARFGDSWSLRLTARPAPGVELAASVAAVVSPEHRPGGGPTDRKVHLGGRLDRPIAAGEGSLLVEWARSSEHEGFFVFHSGLGEMAWSRGRHRLAYRWERTERPEEERISAFRTARPHLENGILGISRWTIHTGQYTLRVSPAASRLQVAALIEGAAGRVRTVGAGTFDPVATYGRETFWTVTLGLRVGWRGDTGRMGRYGLADDEPAHHH